MSPHYEYGQMVGKVVAFSAEQSQDRHRYPYDGEDALGAVRDIKLLELLLRAQKGM